MFNDITDGDAALSTAKSLNDRWVLWSYLASFSTVTSPERQNKKKVVKEAAHNILSLKEILLPPNQMALSFLRMVGIIGRCEREGFPFFSHSTLIPF